ncbi:hypothetical protein D3C78_1738970 [compost metagenome]
MVVSPVKLLTMSPSSVISLAFCSTPWLVANSCEPLIASVLVALRRPAATLVMVRSLPTEPTLTVLVGAVPAKS